MAREVFCDPFALRDVRDSEWEDVVPGLPLGWTRSKPVQPMLDRLDALDDVAKKARSSDLNTAANAGDRKTFLQLVVAPLRSSPPEEVDKKGIKVARKLNAKSFLSSLKEKFGK